MDFARLKEAPLFRGLSEVETEQALSLVSFRTRGFREGLLISQSGEPVNSLFVVLSGAVRGEMVDAAGRVIRIEEITAPGALASAFIFGKRNRFPVNVIALSDGELLIVDKPDFLKLLMHNDTILINYLNIISDRSQFLSEKIKFLNFKTIKSKLAHYLLQRSTGTNVLFRPDMTQTELADYFGVARPSLSRALGELVKAGLIEPEGRDIRILDRKGLSDLTAE